MEINGDSNATFWKAYPKPNVDLWDQNVLYVIAYELSPGLDHKLQNMLPEVNSRFSDFRQFSDFSLESLL